MTFIAGGFWRICDRCGKKVRNYNTTKQWDGLIVCTDGCFEERQSQDFVRGVKDNQNVPDPRPEQALSFIGALETNLTAAAIAGAINLYVESSIRFLPGDTLGVTLSDGNIQRVTLQSVPSSSLLTLAISTPLKNSALSGAIITNYSAISQPDLG